MSEELEFKKIEITDMMSVFYLSDVIDDKDFNKFENALEKYLNGIKEQEEKKDKNVKEDQLKVDYLIPFLQTCGFKMSNAYTVDKSHGNSTIDLVTVDEDNDVEVIIETKIPKSNEFVVKDLNCKAFQEALLYYMRLRSKNNSSLKHIILTNFYEFYIFEAKEFEALFNQKDIKKFYDNWSSNNNLFKNVTSEFYTAIQKLIKDKSITGIKFDLRDFEDKQLLYKVFHPDFLLNKFNPNDANELNSRFYHELLYLLGLVKKEIKSNSSIKVSDESLNKKGTLYYNIAKQLGIKVEEDINEDILSIIVIWLNRILFLKLLEANLIKFNDESLKFLNSDKIKNYSDLSNLFFNILAKGKDDRDESELSYLPYLNSSLFIKQDRELVDIATLSNLKLPYFKNTQIKDKNGKKLEGEVEWLEYLFNFLDAFDFGAIPNRETVARKELINASVLGLVFEQLNGYKDGSFYTKSVITSYMCNESLDKVVVDKFNVSLGWKCKTIDDIKIALDRFITNKENLNTANRIFNEIRICDPAVGSGHFLVSALNKMVDIYYKLGLLNIPIADLKIENDEIIIIDNDGEIFEYKRPKANTSNHKIQMAIFNVKKSIIENNLFGVDVNPNSCDITKLRLWIELLKNTYYLSFDNDRYHNMQTLPNIDINIQCGNSLISNIDLAISKENFLDNLKERIENADMFEQSVLKKEFKQISEEMPKMFEKAKESSKAYKNAGSKNEAKEYKKNYEASIAYLIKVFKRTCNEYINFYSSLHDFFEEYGYINIDNIKETEIKNKLINYIEIFDFHHFVDFEKKQVREINPKELAKIKTVMVIYEEFERKQTFEWRFEFPEVLDNDGNFKGFDIVIGNPPYIQLQKIKGEVKDSYENAKFETFTKSGDIYQLFFEKCFNLLSQKGIVSLITSNKWMRADYGSTTRKYFYDNANVFKLIDLGPYAFDKPAVDTNITFYSKLEGKANGERLIPAMDLTDQKGEYDFNTKIETIRAFNDKEWVIMDENERSIYEKISKHKPLKNWDIKINYGVKTGFNEAFIIDEETKNRLIKEDKKSAELIKPILRGRDIKRYSYDFAKLYLINTHNGVKEKNILPVDVGKYKAIKKHLDKYYPHLETRQDKGDTPYNLRNCAYLEEFDKEKIVYPNMNKEFLAYYDNKGFFTNQKCFIITSKNENLRYLTGLLNSKANFWYFKQIGATLGNSGYEMSKIFIEKLPIPKPDKKTQSDLVALVDKIIEGKKKEGKEADTSEFEKQIDSAVYRLYGLSDEEIEIVEGK